MVLAVGVVLAGIAGLFSYISMTATPLHPDAARVPSVVRSAPEPKWNESVERGRQAARRALIEQNLPGLSVAVGVGSELVWAEGFGYADLETHRPVTPEMRFRIAEVSNTLTSAAVGLLLEQKKLKLDEEIQTYVPEFPTKQWPVTLRQLMAQVAGIRNDAGDEEPLSMRCARTVDGIERFKNASLRFEPGTEFRSSSYGWILVSAAVEAAAREPFFTFMRDRVFAPLQMAGTRPDNFEEAIPNRVTFYFPRFAGNTRYGPELARDGDQSCFAGAGAFLSTPSDLVRFGLGLDHGALLQPATLELLHTPQRLTSGQQTQYGLGWALETISLGGAPTRMAGHGTKEDFIGGTAYLMTFPEPGLAVAATTNISFADMKSLAASIAAAFAAHR
jgi:CubicO group peptidase (beta-lactamase class C family)